MLGLKHAALLLALHFGHGLMDCVNCLISLQVDELIDEVAAREANKLDSTVDELNPKIVDLGLYQFLFIIFM